MDSDKRSPSIESNLEAPYVGDTRTFSDFIMYVVNAGRFQHNNLLDSGRRKGVLSLVQAERVVKLTLDRRLSPIHVSFTPGGRRQLVYLVSLVRAEVTSEELDQLVDTMNEYLEGKTTQEKEKAVIDLIHGTASRVSPGVRYLPIHWYRDGEHGFANEIYDEYNRHVDGAGLPILNSEDEVIAIQQGQGRERTNSKDIPMPSTSAVLSDPSTDSERGPGTYKKKRSAPPINWDNPQASTSRGSDNFEQPRDVEQEPPDSEFAIEDTDMVDDDGNARDPRQTSHTDHPDPDKDVMTRAEFQKEMAKLLEGFSEVKQAVSTISGASKKASPAQMTSTGARREATPQYYNDAESELDSYFPINQYTEPMDWLLKQPIVHTFFHYEVIRRVYRKHPIFKPESDVVLSSYMDYVASTRLQTHFAKATTRVTKMDYGKFPMPMVFVKIALDQLMDLGKQRIPGTKDVATFIKDRCANTRRSHVLNSEFILESDSQQEMAHRLLAEREDFVSMHAWIFDKLPKVKWDYNIELNKTLKLVVAQGKKSDPSFDGMNEPFPEEIQLLIFPDMDKGKVLDSMEEAQALVASLEQAGITKPMFPRAVWDTIKSIVHPSAPEVAMARKSEEAKKVTKEARQERRRLTYKAKREAAAKNKEDTTTSDDDADDPLPIDNTDKQEEPAGAKKTPDKDEPSAKKSRQEVIRDIMGNVSDVSSESPQNKEPNVAYQVTGEGTMVFTQDEEEKEHAEDEAQGVKPSGADQTIKTPTGPMATGQLLTQAQASGVVTEEDQVMIAADVSAELSSTYSVIVNSPGSQEPTVVAGGSHTQQKFNETLTKPPVKKSMIQRYQDMEESVLDTAAMEGRSSSSSSSNDQEVAKRKDPRQPTNQPRDAASPGVAMHLNQEDEDHDFKIPKSVLATKQKRPVGKGKAKGNAKSKGKAIRRSRK